MEKKSDLQARESKKGNNDSQNCLTSKDKEKRPFSIKKICFATLTFLAQILLLLTIKPVIDINNQRQKERPDYPLPQWSDLKYSILAGLLMFCLKNIFMKLSDFIEQFVDPGKKGVELRKQRAQKMTSCLFKFFFYLVSTCIGYYVLWYSKYAPRSLGFQYGNPEDFEKNYPFQDFTYDPYVRYYIL